MVLFGIVASTLFISFGWCAGSALWSKSHRLVWCLTARKVDKRIQSCRRRDPTTAKHECRKPVVDRSEHKSGELDGSVFEEEK